MWYVIINSSLDCLKVCSTEYDPICGSDDMTYQNLCDFENGQCRNKFLLIQRYSKCPGKLEKAVI